MQQNWKKNTVLFLTSQMVSLFGSSLVQYAIMWYITLQTKSGVMMMISILCGFLPTFLLAPFAGVWADRYDRKILIALSDSVIALSTLGMAVLFLLGYKAMWLLFVISAVRALGSAVQTPCVGAFLPQLVPVEKLTAVNGINSSIQSAILLFSPIASGALMSAAPIETIFFIDVGTAAIGVFTLLFFLRVPARAGGAAPESSGYLEGLRLGFSYIGTHPYLKRFFLFLALFTFLAAPVAFLTPLQVTRSFGEEAWYLTAVEIAFSLGMMLGGLLMACWGGLRNRVHTMALSGFLIGIGVFLLGIVTDFWVYLALMGLVGFVMPIFNTPSTVLLQEKVEPDYLGRVFGVLTMITSMSMPLGMLLFGPLSDWIKIEWMLVATGMLIFVEGLFLIFSKKLVEAGRNPV